MIKIPELKIGNIISSLPIVQGGMGVGISLSGLASAVANEGGIGVIAAAMVGISDPQVIKDQAAANTSALAQEIRKAKELTKGVLGVNIMVALTNYVEMVQTAVKEKIDIIFTGAGLPLDLPGYLTEGARTKLVPIVSSGRAAMILCKKWLSKFNYLPDAFVVEGPKAGGHLGFKAEELDDPKFDLKILVQDVLEAVKKFEISHNRKIPVIAAGGIYDGNDIHEYLQMGAAGVQMGTRFVATHECDADLSFKQSYINAQPDDVVVIKSPVGLPGRAIRNNFIDRINQGERIPKVCPYHCLKTCEPEKSPFCIALALDHARKGLLKSGFAFAGQNAHRIKEIISVKELMTSLAQELRQKLSELNPLKAT